MKTAVAATTTWRSNAFSFSGSECVPLSDPQNLHQMKTFEQRKHCNEHIFACSKQNREKKVALTNSGQNYQKPNSMQ